MIPPTRPPEYLDSDTAVAGFIDAIAGAPALALDTEGASFHRYVDRTYLIQLATAERSAVIDPLAIVDPTPLRQLLGDPRVEVIIHDAVQDLRHLGQDYGLRVAHLYDTRIAARLLGMTTQSLAGLLDELFGVKLDKQHQMADFSARPLPPALIEYAARDTLHLLPLRDLLAARLAAAGRTAWAAEECQVLAGATRPPTVRGPRHLRVKEARKLTPRQLAVLAELCEWQDALARQRNVPLFRVAADELLLELARRQPDSTAALGELRGLPRNLRGPHLAAILAAIARGVAVPEAELSPFPVAPRVPHDREFDALVSRLGRARDRVAAALQLDPTMMFPRAQLEEVARARPSTFDELAALPSVRRWQAEQLAEALLAVITA